MNLTDREILELSELCGALADETLTEVQRARLSSLLRQSEAARRYYVRAMGDSASLFDYAAEIHTEAPDRRPLQRPLRPTWGWAFGMVAIAAAVTFGVFFRPSPPSAPANTQFVARITGARDAKWSKGGVLSTGAPLRRGQELGLLEGYVEVTFDSGARLVVEGNTALIVNSAWDATLRHGAVKASVPTEAVGFRLSHSAVDVVDLGTEFSMLAEAGGAAEVLVLKGEVEAAPRMGDDQATVLLREKESRRFAQSGVSDVADSARKFEVLTRPFSFDRLAGQVGYVHWSFDENGGPTARAEVSGGNRDAADLALRLGAAADLGEARTNGPAGRGHALHFDGEMYARANFPGLSDSAARTVAFWTRIAPDAQPIDTWMVSWATHLPKLGSRPVQISWNRRPTDGVLGALRTDFGGGHAIGSTSLRDGQWHHVSVYFAPGEEADTPVQVKLYVDGRLESSTIVPGTVRGPASSGQSAQTDIIWLGYRLTGKQDGRRFRGDLDELFVTDRGLEPNEIVGLMRDNRPPSSVVALSKP